MGKMREVAEKWLWCAAAVLILTIIFSPHGEKKTEKMPDGQYENIYMISLKKERMVVVAEGKQWEVPCPIGKEVEKENEIVTITVEENKVSGITWKEGRAFDRVLSIDGVKRWAVFEKNGQVELDENCKAYQILGGNVKEITQLGSLINWKQAEAVIIGGRAVAAVVRGEPDTSSIKVLIHGEEKGVYHNSVRLTASGEYEVEKDGETISYEAGQEFSFEEGESCAVSCKNGKIRLLSLARSSHYPEYRGKLWIERRGGGYLVINELKLEEYLYSVVSSEMPSDYPKEALNAQAVCARTYALYQMGKSFYSPYGANVDDTVNSQVYNNIPETKESRRAVKDTQEQYMEYQNSPVAAYFYSTSCGVTSDASDVWIEEGENPPYLKGHFQGKEKNSYDLSSEEAFSSFIRGKEGRAFEKEEPWFRWKAKVPLEELSAYVNRGLASWTKNSPSFFLSKNKKGYGKRQIDTIGEIKDVSVEKRSSGGVVEELILTGSDGQIKIIGEYQVRMVLCPSGTRLTLADGSSQECSMLASAYCSFQVKDGELTIYGGGYGHGVGLSQNGAKVMAELGYGYEDILDFYYPGVTLVYGY